MRISTFEDSKIYSIVSIASIGEGGRSGEITLSAPKWALSSEDLFPSPQEAKP